MKIYDGSNDRLRFCGKVDADSGDEPFSYKSSFSDDYEEAMGTFDIQFKGIITIFHAIISKIICNNTYS